MIKALQGLITNKLSWHFSMNYWNQIDESNKFFKAFQMVLTIGASTSKIDPRSSRGVGGVDSLTRP